MGDFKIKKRVIVGCLVLLLAVDGGLAYHNSRLSARDENPDATLRAESLQVALVKKDIERVEKISAAAGSAKVF
jgi:hypothetical protein